MKSLIFILVLFASLSAQETQMKLLKKGDTLRADQDYALLTIDGAKQAVKERVDLKALKEKEIEYKKIIYNDSLQIFYLNENLKFYKEMRDTYKTAWQDVEEQLTKKVKRSWYENKFLWFTLGISTVYISSEIVANVK